MSKEKEMQDELDKYWGQMDRVEKLEARVDEFVVKLENIKSVEIKLK